MLSVLVITVASFQWRHNARCTTLVARKIVHAVQAQHLDALRIAKRERLRERPHETATPNRCLGQFSKPALHQIQPTGTGRHKVAYKARMLLQPRLHARVFVRSPIGLRPQFRASRQLLTSRMGRSSRTFAHMDFRPAPLKVHIVHIRFHQRDAVPIRGSRIRSVVHDSPEVESFSLIRHDN